MLHPSLNLLLSTVLLLLSLCSATPIVSSSIETRAGIATLEGNPVVFGAGTYPRANRLSDGSIIGAYTAFNGGYNIIEVVRSTDGGQTQVSQPYINHEKFN